MKTKTAVSIAIAVALFVTIALFVALNYTPKEDFASVECSDPDTNLKISDAEIAKDAKNLIINQGMQVKKLYTENGIDLISPKVADHILVEVMEVRKRPIYEQYPACAKQLAKTLKHEMGGIH